ncbi:MAG: hypothetical protein R2708_07715 [Vicinamibacterales bacterium]
MTTYLRLLPLAALLSLPAQAQAAPAEAACTVQISYTVNGTTVESYSNSFTLTRDAVFVDDLSTPIRAREFRATLTRTADGLVVFVNYFSDVSTFNAIDLDTSLRLRGAGALVTDSGSHTFSSSQAVPAGNHTTSHTLVCSRQ